MEKDRHPSDTFGITMTSLDLNRGPSMARGIKGTALVTGAALRVGREIAIALGADGFDVIVHYRSSFGEAESCAQIIRDHGSNAQTIQADLANGDEVTTMFAKIRRDHDRLDVLVNSAGVFRRTPIDQITVEDLDFHLDVNLRAAYRCIISAIPMMTAGGRIINISDVAAQRPFSNHIPYCISKAGVDMLTKGMAKALAKQDITVNAIAPGTVLFRTDETPDQREFVVSRIPIGHIGTPSDIAKTVQFLIDSPHITGTIIPVDGGRSLD